MSIAGKKSKIKIAAAVATVLILTVVVLPFLTDADQFRPQIESRLSAELGRDVRLGKLRLSLFSGRFTVDDISIMENPIFGDAPFVTARSLYIGVERRPLIFSKRVHITDISLDSPSIYLRRTAGGEWNFSDLGAAKPDEAKFSAAGLILLPEIVIRRLRITNGRIEIIEAEKMPSAYEKVTFSIDDLSRTAASPFTLAIALQGGGMFTVHGTFGPLNRDDTLLTPFTAALEITHFDPAASGVIPAAAGFSGLFHFNGDLGSDGSMLQSKGKVSVANLQFGNAETRAGRPVSLDYDLRYDLKKKTGALTDATVGLGQSAMHLYGDFDAGREVTSLKMTLKGNGVQVDELQEFLPATGVTLPKGTTLSGGILNVEITAEGPLNDLIMDYSVEVTETSLIGFSIIENITLAAGLSGLKSSPDTQIEKLYTSMRRTADGIAVNTIQLIIPALGEISGKGTISPRQELDLVMRAAVRPGELEALTRGRSLDINFIVRGVTANPEFIPDYKDAALTLIDAILTGKDTGSTNPVNQLMDALKGFLGNK